MAISKDDTVLTYSKFKEFWTQFAEKFNKKLDGGGIKNNLTTTDEGYVLDARAGKTLNDKISTLQDQTNGIYLATNSAGKWGYKTSKNGAVTPFRNPTGDAVAANVLVGKTFANASSDALTGTMPNNGSMTATLTPTGNNTVTKTIPAGYTAGGTITANGATAYAAGKVAATPTKVGTGTGNASFSVLSIAKNYASLTAANFLLVPTGLAMTGGGGGTSTPGTITDSVKPTVTYNASTAQVQVSGAEYNNKKTYEWLTMSMTYSLYVYGISN